MKVIPHILDRLVQYQRKKVFRFSRFYLTSCVLGVLFVADRLTLPAAIVRMRITITLNWDLFCFDTKELKIPKVSNYVVKLLTGNMLYLVNKTSSLVNTLGVILVILALPSCFINVSDVALTKLRA